MRNLLIEMTKENLTEMLTERSGELETDKEFRMITTLLPQKYPLKKRLSLWLNQRETSKSVLDCQ